MIKTLHLLSACAFLACIVIGIPTTNAQEYTCSTLESISEINLLKSKKSNFVIFAEDSHNDNLINRQHVFDYMVSIKQQGFNQLALEAAVAYEYVSSLEDTTVINGLVGPLNYSFLRRLLLYNKENQDTPVNVRGFDVETYPPFALNMLDFILKKYPAKPKELDELHLAIEKIRLMSSEEEQSDSIKELAIKIKQYNPRSTGVFSESDSAYFFKISNNLKMGVLFNFKDWKLREKYIFQNIESINNESNNKSVILIGSQHVDKKVYRNVPSLYTMMLEKGMLKPETDSAPVILFKKDNNTAERLGLYKIPKKDKEYIMKYISQYSGLIYCAGSKIEKPAKGYLFYE